MAVVPVNEVTMRKGVMDWNFTFAVPLQRQPLGLNYFNSHMKTIHEEWVKLHPCTLAQIRDATVQLAALISN
jgi:hypothetical protein